MVGITRLDSYRFYYPARGTKLVEAISAKFLENDMGGFDIFVDKVTNSNKEQLIVSIPIVQERFVYQPNERAGEVPRQEVTEDVPPSAPKEPIENPPFRWSHRERRHVNLDDYYYTFLGESDFNIGCMLGLENYKEAICSVLSDKWIDAMNDELLSMNHNGVWELVEALDGSKPIICK
ncbi:F-box protein [Sesbania bispinosa]|nr:F-box protein [Sesbania bispinosa]